MKSAQRDNQEFLLEHSGRFFKNGTSHHHIVTLFRRHFAPRKVRYALMTALALSVTPFTCADARQFSSIVAFGDSYADTGNIQDIMSMTPGYGPTLAGLNFYYPTGRFSGGTNYIDTLSSIYGISQTNYALGGAQTGVNNAFFGLPGFTQEWKDFLASGHVIAPNALVTLNIGGNDARSYYQNGGLMGGVQSEAKTAADNTTTGINALVGAGAKTLVFTAGNVAGLPEAAGYPTSSVAVGLAYSQTYNSLMQHNLSAVAASGVRVEYVDLAMIESNVVSNPSLYGLQYATTLSPVANASNSALVNEYLFYFDGIHLTSAGFAIVADYIANRLNAPATFASSCNLGLSTADAFVDNLFDRLDLFNVATVKSSGASGVGSNAYSVFVQGNGIVSNRSYSDNSQGYHSDGLGATLGIEYRLSSETMVGSAYSFDNPSLNLNRNAGTTSAAANQLGLYGTFKQKNIFLQGLVSHGWLYYCNSRAGVVSKITAKPNGDTFAAALKGGYLFDVTPSVRFGPIAGLSYVQAHVTGYSENGDPVLTLNLNEQTAKTVLGSVGAQARYALDLGSTKLESYLNFTVENNFEGSDRVIQYSATSAPLIVNSWTATGASNHAFVRLASGANANLTSTISVMLNLSQTIGQPGGNDFFCTGGMKISF